MQSQGMRFLITDIMKLQEEWIIGVLLRAVCDKIKTVGCQEWKVAGWASPHSGNSAIYSTRIIDSSAGSLVKI